MVMKLLLINDSVNLNHKDIFNQTRLWFTIENRYETVVKLLLTNDNIDLDSKNKYNQTPLL